MKKKNTAPVDRIPRKNVGSMVSSLAEVLDSQHKHHAEIRVRAASSTLRKYFGKRADDGEFYCGSHRLVLHP